MKYIYKRPHNCCGYVNKRRFLNAKIRGYNCHMWLWKISLWISLDVSWHTVPNNITTVHSDRHGGTCYYLNRPPRLIYTARRRGVFPCTRQPECELKRSQLFMNELINATCIIIHCQFICKNVSKTLKRRWKDIEWSISLLAFPFEMTLSGQLDLWSLHFFVYVALCCDKCYLRSEPFFHDTVGGLFGSLLTLHRRPATLT